MKIKDLIMDRLEIPVSRFCKEVGVSRATINAILNDKYKFNLRLLTIKKICKYFNVDFKDYVE